jgi:hypothetical protein
MALAVVMEWCRMQNYAAHGSRVWKFDGLQDALTRVGTALLGEVDSSPTTPSSIADLVL